MLTLMLIRHRLGMNTSAASPTAAAARTTIMAATATARVGPSGRHLPHLPHLPHVPEEIWLAVCAFLRSADFARRYDD